ncbi:hypothetical protein VKT23_016504 [Stygiomarasmius scandens]|uniref:Non-specific serine/threonine protein kinase n=1 Tax=Marasmiellus scandens TaxID=2682957 RepID=A0ABR1IZI4_9AGAR
MSSVSSSGASTKSSRFSTLKVFGKFGSSNKDSLKPPPLPPKDVYFRNNRSLVSLSTESNPGTPATPSSASLGPPPQLQSLQAQYAQKSGPFHPASSMMSLVSSVDYTSDSQQTERQAIKPKKSGFFKLKRGPKSPSVMSTSTGDDLGTPESAGEDENISMPWNFTHNIHVDETYNGMPPSWTVSLAEAGFTEVEIAAIYARKQAGTLTPGGPGSIYNSERPRSPMSIKSSTSTVPSSQFRSPSISSGGSNAPTVPTLTRQPPPRSTSLPRQFSDASLRSQGQPQPFPVNPMVGRALGNGLPSNPRPQRSRNNSGSSTALSISVESGAGRPNVVLEQGTLDGEARRNHKRDRSGSQGQGQKSSPLGSKPSRPYASTTDLVSGPQEPSPSESAHSQTRRTYYVANGSPAVNSLISPPPAYGAVAGARVDEDNEEEQVETGPNGYPLEKTPGVGRSGSKRRRTDATIKRNMDLAERSPSPRQSTSSRELSEQEKRERRQSRRRSKRTFPGVSSHGHSDSVASAQSSSGSGAGSHHSRSESGSSRGHRKQESFSTKLNLPLDLGASLGLGLGFSLDLDSSGPLESWSESVLEKLKSPTPSTFDKTTSNLSTKSLTTSSPSTQQPEQQNSLPPSRSPTRPPQPKRPVPPVVIEDHDSPTSAGSQFSFPISQTPISPPSSASKQFPMSPLSPGLSPTPPATAASGSTGAPPTSANTMLSVSPSPNTGLFNELMEIVGEPGRKTGKGRKGKSNGKTKRRRSRDASPIRRIRGDDYDDDDEEEEGVSDEEEDEEEERDRYSAPALSESHSPTIPLSPRGRNEDGNRASAYRIRGSEAIPVGIEEQVGQDDRLLSAGIGRKVSSSSLSTDSNRNSTRSSTSTMSNVTVTHLTATSTVVRRAVATKVDIVDVSKDEQSSSRTSSPKPSPTVIDKPLPSPSVSSLRTRSPVPPALPLPDFPAPPSSMPRLNSPRMTEFMRPESPGVSSLRHPASPQSSTFGSEEDSASTYASGSGSMSFKSSKTSTTSTSTSPTTEHAIKEEPEEDNEDGVVYYLDNKPSPRPTQTNFPVIHEHHKFMKSVSDTFGGAKGDTPPPTYVPDDDYEVIQEEEYAQPPCSKHLNNVNVSRSPTLGNGSANATTARPTIVISNTSTIQPGPLSSLASAVTPITPAHRYRGWLSEVVKPLEQFIDEAIDPREYYLDLQEIAEGESGSVFAARISPDADLGKLGLPPMVKAQDIENQESGQTSLVAIKSVAILPSGSAKLDDLKKELALLKGLAHPNVLGLDALYVDLVEDSLWIRMELMERSLADVVGLVDQGLVLQERTIARFTSDILEALQYLRDSNIAHRDVRSDNLLLNSDGVLKLTDFSNAVRVSTSSPICTDNVGVLYWQAPEVRSGSYNPLKVDVWSVGATVWEMAEAEPPFASTTSEPADRWPALKRPQLYSPAFRDFLRLCSEPAASRPDPLELLKNGFVSNTCGRAVIVQLLQQCMAIEKVMQEQDQDSDS